MRNNNLRVSPKGSINGEATMSSVLSEVDNAKALVIFAHGAGAGMNHEYMEVLTQLMNEQHLNVLRFNFPYMDKRKLDGKRRPPDRMPVLIDCYQSLITNVKTDLPIFIGGKSMGGRVAATLANNKSFMDMHNIKGVVCLGYPFHPIKKPEKLRLLPLQESQTPVLILQGDRDALGSKAEVNSYKISPRCQVHFFDDGDHDLKPRVKSGKTLAHHQQAAVSLVGSFIDEINTSC